MAQEMRYYSGCDVGSTTGKAVIINDNGIVATSIVPSEIDPEDTANKALEAALKQVKDIKRVKDLACLVGTGYGRTEVPFADINISEISCHAMGAHCCNPKIKTIIDIGGQDVKGISLNDDGSVLDFAMNDKCAAGTGKFYEAMSRTFRMDLSQFSDLSLNAKKSIPVTSQCSVFAESEVISLFAKKNSPADIALGIQEAVARRCLMLLKRVGIRNDVVMTGGCAKNKGLVKALKSIAKIDIVSLSIDPQLIGAFGAAVLAKKRKNKISE